MICIISIQGNTLPQWKSSSMKWLEVVCLHFLFKILDILSVTCMFLHQRTVSKYKLSAVCSWLFSRPTHYNLLRRFDVKQLLRVGQESTIMSRTAGDVQPLCVCSSFLIGQEQTKPSWLRCNLSLCTGLLGNSQHDKMRPLCRTLGHTWLTVTSSLINWQRQGSMGNSLLRPQSAFHWYTHSLQTTFLSLKLFNFTCRPYHLQDLNSRLKNNINSIIQFSYL